MRKRRSLVLLVAGVAILMLGVSWLLDQLDIHLNLPYWVYSWQMFLIVMGILFASTSEKKSTGGLMIAVGSIFLALDILDIEVEFWRLVWPVLLILAGVSLIIRYFRPISKLGEKIQGPLICNAILSGVKKSPTMEIFEGGQFTAFMGGIEVSLLATRLNGNPAVIDVQNLLGGIKIMVPASWTVRFESTNILGGAEEKRKNPTVSPDPNQVLIIRGLNFMGGIEVISY